jgi:AraC family transcriptional regulator
LADTRVAHLAATTPPEEVAEHSHEDTHFVLATRGRYITTAQGDEGEGPVLVYNPPGVVHRDRFEGVDGWFMAISVEAEAWRDLTSHSGAAVNALRLRSPRAVGTALRLTRAALSRDVERIDLETHALALAGEAMIPAKRESQKRPTWLDTAESFLADSFDQPIGIADIARAAGVHRVHLARGYQRWIGTAPGERLRARRLERAADLMMHGRAGIGEVALQAGFCDQSHMNRQFRAAYGMTPGEFARLCGRRRPDVSAVQDEAREAS